MNARETGQKPGKTIFAGLDPEEAFYV